MQRMHVAITAAAASWLALAQPGHASPIDFDCDTMPDHFSSVSLYSESPNFSLTGTLTIVEKRSGHFLPLAGVVVRQASIEHKNDFFGFQIVATKDGRPASNVTLRDHASLDSITSVGTLDDAGEKPFSFSVTKQGDIILVLDGKTYSATIPRISRWSRVRVDLMCSTGQFKFFGATLLSSPGS